MKNDYHNKQANYFIETKKTIKFRGQKTRYCDTEIYILLEKRAGQTFGINNKFIKLKNMFDNESPLT